MDTKVKIEAILEGMELQMEENIAFVHKGTGEVIFVLKDHIRDADDGKPIEELSLEWQQEELKQAYDVVDHEDRYAALPTEFEIDEYSMIEEFCFSVTDSKSKETLLRSIRGKGAFRRFKDKVFDLDLEQDWFDYRDECYKQMAIEFCENNGFNYIL